MSIDFDEDKCRTDIYEQGEFVVALDIPKVQANILCAALTNANDSYDFDWQYSGGRVCVRQLKRIPQGETMLPKSSVNTLVDFAFDKLGDASITTNYFRTHDDKPLVLMFFTQKENEPRQYHAVWTEDGRTHGHIALGVCGERDKFIRNCYERDSITVVPSAAYRSLTQEDHVNARDRAIEILKAWE